MARSSWTSTAVVVLSVFALLPFVGCTRKATVSVASGGSGGTTQQVEADSLLRVALTAVFNPEDRNLVMQEKTPEQLLAEKLIEFFRLNPEFAKTDKSGRPVVRKPKGLDGADEGFERYNYQLEGGSITWVEQEDGSRIPVPEGFDSREPTLVFNNGDTFDDAVDHLNQWIGLQLTPPAWTRDSMIDTLPSNLQNSGVIYTLFNGLPELKFTRDDKFRAIHDGWALQEIVWCRDVSQRVAGNSHEALDQAVKLFDWTTRAIQLLEGPALPIKVVNGRDCVDAAPLSVWEAMLKGEGHIEHRAWIFTLLARQQGLDVVMLAVPGAEASAKPTLWACGLLHDKQLYLFDLELGTPIPGPNGMGVATLSQAASDPTIFQALDLPGRPYPLKPEDVAKSIAFIEASPTFLSRRMAVLQSALAGVNTLVLTVSPTRIAAGLREVKEVESSRLWEFPYRNLRVLTAETPITEERYSDAQNSLRSFYLLQQNSATLRADMWCARVADLKGKFVVEATADADSATMAVSADRQAANPMYLLMRKESLAVEQAIADPRTPAGLRDGYRMSVQPFTHRAAQDASLFLGQIAWERAQTANTPALRTQLLNTAANFFQRDVLGDAQSPRRGAAHYNLGRTYEAANKTAAAIQAYKGDDSPMKWASLYRATLLEKAPAATAATP